MGAGGHRRTRSATLERFTDTIYLSQTTERRDGELTRYLNLGDAIAAWRADPGGAREWRTHFHVPVFLDEIGGFRTTRVGIEAALDMHARTPLSDHLEIETYTWDVLPDAPEDRRHRRVRQPRDRVGPRPADRGRVRSAPAPDEHHSTTSGGADPWRDALQGKNIIVTGAGSGMGRAFALGLAREGATVGVLDLREEAGAVGLRRTRRRRGSRRSR